MTRVSTAVVVAFFMLFLPNPAVAEEPCRETEVRAAVSAFGRAFVEADVSALATFLTANYVHINGRSGSVLNRDDWLRWVESRRAELDSGELVVSTYRIEDVRVELSGDIAVVTGVAFLSGTRNGNALTSQLRFSNVWILKGGTWRRAAFHDSPLPDPESAR